MMNTKQTDAHRRLARLAELALPSLPASWFRWALSEILKDCAEADRMAVKRTESFEFRCPKCGEEEDIQLSFPVWIRANYLDDVETYEVDIEASPEKDSEKCWCPTCDEHVLFEKIEREET